LYGTLPRETAEARNAETRRHSSDGSDQRASASSRLRG